MGVKGTFSAGNDVSIIASRRNRIICVRSRRFRREIDVKSSSTILERKGERRGGAGLVSRFEELEEIHEEKGRKGVVKEPSADVAGNPCVRPTKLIVAHLAVSVFALPLARMPERNEFSASSSSSFAVAIVRFSLAALATITPTRLFSIPRISFLSIFPIASPRAINRIARINIENLSIFHCVHFFGETPTG